MDTAPPQPDPTTTAPPSSVSQLPPEALALASRLFDAARTGDLPILQQALTHGLPANLTNDKGDSLLMLAAYHGHADILRLLISKGADTNRLNDRGQSPLAGVVFKHEKECIEILLEAGADPEVGTPSALDATMIFKQEEYKQLFLGQIEKLKALKARAVNGAS